MKWNYQYKYTLGLVILIIFAVSCKKSFSERVPINGPTDANFWLNEGEAISGVAGSYGQLRIAMNEMGMAHFYYGDTQTDQFTALTTGEDYPAITQMNWQTFIAPSETFRGLIKLRRWDNFYRAIDQMNRCIKFIEPIPLAQFTSIDKQGAKNQLIGENYFLRAFTYFYMSRIWGDVPLVVESAADAAGASNIKRTAQKQVLDQCIKDLNEAIKLMPYATAPTASRAIRANRGTCYALLAHIYAWTGEYDKVVPAADSVILRGGYSHVTRANKTTYLNMFRGNSSEGIFEISQNANNEGAGIGTSYGAITNNIAGRTLKAPYLLTNLGNTFFPLDAGNLNVLFPMNADSVDLRRRNGFDFWGTTDPICVKYSNILYSGPNNTSPLSLNNIIVFRLADIKLLKAEALASSGNIAGAKAIVDEIRALAGLDPINAPAATFFETVIQERGRELFMEGHRFYDLVRLARKTNIIRFNGTGTVTRMDITQFNQGKYYWPIDPILMSLNPVLVQTPFWADKM
jgi:hypothetical protein